MEYIELFIDDDLKNNFTCGPYSWKWDEKTFGKHTIKAIANNDNSNLTTDEITVWKLF